MRRKAGKTDLLATVPLFSQCTSKELSRIAALAAETSVPSGEVLTREGRSGRECFLIADGTAKVTLRRRTIATLGPGAFVGEMSLLDGGPRAATVTATTPMRVYVLDPSQFFTLIEDFPSIARKVLRSLAERLRDAEKAPTH